MTSVVFCAILLAFQVMLLYIGFLALSDSVVVSFLRQSMQNTDLLKRDTFRIRKLGETKLTGHKINERVRN